MAEVDKYPEQLQAAANILKADMMMNIIRILQGMPLATLDEQKAEVAKFVGEFTIPNMAFLTTCDFSNLRGEKIVVLPEISFTISAELPKQN